MIKIEEKLKECGKLPDFERAVVLNDLQSVYSIVEDIIDNSEPVKSVVLDLVSCCDFALWLQDNYSANKKQGGTDPLPKGYWRKDFTNEHYSVTELAELYKKSYS